MSTDAPLPSLGAIFLAGGKSSRMGRDKGFVDFRGRPMAAWGLELLRSFTKDVLIVANREEYKAFGLPVVADEYHDLGPLAGIVTGLRHSQADLNIVLSCDMPLMNVALIQWMLESYDDEAAMVCRWEDRLQPLAGLYHKRALPDFERLVERRQLKISVALEVVGAAVLEPDLYLPGFDAGWFRNFNTPGDLEQDSQNSQDLQDC
ncbi:MAG: molybdenum cofactor guanylyltransferase [Bacteroidia bacterium]